MSYVTGCRNDVFLSYAHDDDATWIASFEDELYHHLTERLGQRPSVWQDKNDLRVGQNWVEEIQDAIGSTAAFIAVLSPTYQQSDWCSKERNLFVERLGGVENMRVETADGKRYRFLKVIRLPWEGDAQLEFFREAQHFEFFVRDRKRNFDQVMRAGSREFRENIDYFAFEVCKLLKALRRKKEAIFVASTSDDAETERVALSNELRDQGYNVVAEPIDRFYSDEQIQRELDPALMSIHLIGADYRRDVQRQIDIACRLNKRMVFWVAQGAAANARGDQMELLKRVRTAQNMPGSFWILENGTTREKINAVLNLLKPSEEASSVARPVGAEPWMYLICDRSAPEDVEFAERLQSNIRAEAKVDVALPESGLDSAKAIREAHEELLRQCDGAMLYRRTAPAEWLWENVTDVLFAEKKLSRERPLRAKGFLVDQSRLLEGVPNVPVYLQNENFSLDVINPFLESLRRVPA
jgi:TIR domain